MNPILAILKEHNVSDQKIASLFEALTDNPMMALGLIQQLGIPPEQLKQLMATIMENPALIKEATDELGLDFAKVEAAKEKLKP
ncbi:hypothetical protein DS885_08640 [Psychromonas sp. B3M02]|uniref:DUF2999 family protein n=1 Tax=unclassified Psychromonas TaxID=2614957 RepID=UPI000DEB0FA4|nr:DUF2999 family protein [Psychromonas sp. B3M02]RBW46325.1 hypothetical protein DS885_08640 [Psychromonas sp. B3M02]